MDEQIGGIDWDGVSNEKMSSCVRCANHELCDL